MQWQHHHDDNVHQKELGWIDIKIARMTLTIKLDGNWSSFQPANSAPPLSVTDSATGQSIHSPKEWGSSRKIPTPERAMWAGFAARARPRQHSREWPWAAPVPLTAVQPSPWHRPAMLHPPEQP